MLQEQLLTIRNLSVLYEGMQEAVRDVSLSVPEGMRAGIIGESGSGKSTLLKAIAGILATDTDVQGEVLFEGRSLLFMKEKERNRLMGRKISMIFQNPVSFLDPVRRIRDQMEEVFLLHGCRNRGEARRRAERLLRSLHFRDPQAVLDAYPFELSGGMCQRVSIALAASGEDLKLILADEPTSALDQEIRVHAAEMIREAAARTGAALLFVTHDMRLVEQLAEEVGVMYRGRLVEWGTREEILRSPSHPYTVSLLHAIPTLHTDFSTFRRYEQNEDEEKDLQPAYLSETHWVLR